MKNFSTWILAMSSILYNQVMCSDYSNDFEVFHTSGSRGVKSQSLYPEPSSYNENDFDDDNTESKTIQKRFASFDLSDFEQISAEPEFTRSHLYVSPEDAERRFPRSALGPKNDYVDGYSAFLEKYFDKTDEKHASDYRNEDDEDNKNGKQKDNYRKVPEEVEQIDKEHHYDEAYNDHEYDRIKTLSQKQEQEIKQNPKNCKVVVKGDMKCSICKDPKSGAHSESCAFSSAAPDKKYAYIKQRAYNSKDDDKKKKEDSEEDDEDKPEEDWEGDEEASNKNEKKVKPTAAATPAPTRPRGRARQAQRQSSAYTAPNNAQPQRRQRNQNQQRRYSANYKAEESRPQREVIGLDPFLYKNDEKNDRTYEQYFSHVFPEAKNGKLQRSDDYEANAEAEFLPNYDSKKNVEEVLAEFKTKDWSQCKKEIRGDLTCYHCKDKYGVKNEECMFVSGSAPTRLAYSETKEYHDPEGVPVAKNNDNKNAGSDIVTKTTFVPDTTKTEKSNGKLVVRKRKAKLQENKGTKTRSTTSTTTEAAPKPEDITDHQEGTGKRTIKRMVSYHYEDHSHPEPDVLVYEHNLSHIL